MMMAIRQCLFGSRNERGNVNKSIFIPGEILLSVVNVVLE